MKNTKELSILCGFSVALFAFSPVDIPSTFIGNEKILTMPVEVVNGGKEDIGLTEEGCTWLKMVGLLSLMQGSPCLGTLGLLP